jgi:tRNA (uracil-5-)-methyltransferase
MRIENMKSQNRKFIEFYSGNANHSCYLAEYFTEVLGVEIDKELCNAATINLEMNGITNGVIINKPAEEVAKRRHLYHFDSNDFLLVDPPRAGLDTLTLGLVREFQSVIYIACDARSLARDLEEKGLGVSHTVKYMAAFDHFPWHAEFLEVVCWLEKKDVVSTSS